MWSRKQSVCSAVSGVSRADEHDGIGDLHLYPFAFALRVRVLQIVCGIGGLVVGAVGWLEERQKPVLGLGVPAGAVTVLAAALSVYYSRGFGGWVSARSRTSRSWGPPWRVLGPSACAAVPLTILWTAALGAHVAMFVFCTRTLMNIGCGSKTCIGVAVAQLSISVTTLATAVYMVQLDLRYDAALSPPRRSDAHTCTAVSMFSTAAYILSEVCSDFQKNFDDYNYISLVHRLSKSVPLTSVAVNSGASADGPDNSPLNKDHKDHPPPSEPT